MGTNDKLYTVEEVAEFLRVTKWTVRDYIRTGKLDATKAGKRYLISNEQIQKYLRGE